MLHEKDEALEARDSYRRFFEQLNVTPERFFEFGLQETISIAPAVARAEWENLKRRIDRGDSVAIRGYGRNGARTSFFRVLYSGLLNHDAVYVDPTNNLAPAELLRRTTGFSKRRSAGSMLIANYQVSHVFGRTKNPYAFTAPWNVVYLPKIVDPFTGHEAPGELSAKFRLLFRARIYDAYRPLIEEYNDIMSSDRIVKRAKAILDRLDAELSLPRGFRDDVERELSPVHEQLEA